jgi:hypothetical protein
MKKNFTVTLKTVILAQARTYNMSALRLRQQLR